MTAQEATSAPAENGRMAPDKRPSLLLLTGLAAIGPFAMNIMVPATPALARIFDTSYGVMQLTLTAYLGAMAVMQLVLGPLSDRLGRRPVILIGLLMFLAGSLICGLATSVEVLIGGRVLQSAGGCAGLVIGRAIIRDLFGLEQAASSIGYVTMAMVVAPMLAPLAGGYLFDHLGWQSMFWVSIGLGLLVLLASTQHLHETRRPEALAEAGGLSWGAVLGLMSDRRFCGYVLVLACASGIFFTFLGGAPYVVTEILNRPVQEYGLYFFLSALGYMLGNFLSGRYAVRLGPQRMIAIGCGFAVAGLVLLWALDGVPHMLAVFAPMSLLAISNGLTLPSAMASAVSIRPELAGTASGLSGSAQIGLGAILAFLVGVWQEGSMTALPMITVMTLSGVASFMGFAMTRRG